MLTQHNRKMARLSPDHTLATTWSWGCGLGTRLVHVLCFIWRLQFPLLQEEMEELSRAETKSKVAKFLATEKSIVSKMTNPFTPGAYIHTMHSWEKQDSLVRLNSIIWVCCTGVSRIIMFQPSGEIGAILLTLTPVPSYKQCR